VAKDGVTVNNLVPGLIVTPRNDEALANVEYAKKVLSGIPTGFAGQPSDCAGAALLLCSDAGRYITGVELPVDGGMKL
jgi:NAD(P)-dependent dehydrogenase (short-subunit alcohol dehydrogenase family)